MDGKKKGKYIFDLFFGKKIHTTELIESPLKEKNHIFYYEYTHLYIGILNYYDLLISKLFRSDSIDIEDCLMLFKHKYKEIDINIFKERFIESAKYDVGETKLLENLKYFLNLLKKENYYD